MTYVVDASVAAKWVLDEPLADEAIALRRSEPSMLAPSHFYAELASVVWKRARREELSPQWARAMFWDLAHVPVKIVAAESVVPTAIEMALDLDHPVYDMIYAALAMRRQVPFVTADDRLVAVMRTAGLEQLVIPLRDFTSAG